MKEIGTSADGGEMNMRPFMKVMQGILFVGQLGFLLVTPPLVLIFLANLAQEKLGWGPWVMIAAILVGLLSAGCSVYNLFEKMLRKEKREQPPAAGFNKHI